MMDLTAKQFKPQQESEEVNVEDYLPVGRVNNYHELMHSPFAWECKVDERDGKARWLPILSPIFFQASLNNYEDNGQTDKEAVRKLYRARNCQCIDPRDDRLGKYKFYMGFVKAYNPQFKPAASKFWLTKFENPIMVGDQVEWVLDSEAYDDFRAHLVECGICPINASLARQVTNRQKTHLSMMEQVPFGTEWRREKVEKLRATIKLMEASMDGLAGAKTARQKVDARPLARYTDDEEAPSASAKAVDILFRPTP